MAGVLALPLIDLASPDRDSTAKSIRKACADHGFFYLVNHGIEELLSQQVLAESKKFFSLPLDEKMKLQTRKDNRGYNPLLSHTLDSSSEVQGDASEGIFISSAKISHSQFNANQWPPKELLPCWRATMESCYEKMLAVSKNLISLMALSLGLDDLFFEKIGAWDEPVAYIRLLHYPGKTLERSCGRLGASAHSDFGLATLLLTDGVPGLQICRDKDRRPQLWEDVPHVHGALIVNVGDLLERWTNCLFRSTLHRVLPTEQERYSVAFFLDGDLDCMVECLESCCSKENPPRYVSMADIVDLSSISYSTVETIDFRVFTSVWCGLHMDKSCHGELCCSMTNCGSSLGSFDQCRSLLSGLQGSIDGCTYAVEDDCRTTVWTYEQNNDGLLDSFQPDQELQKKKKISYVRKRRDVYKALGPGSKAEAATILAFGTVFSGPYKGSELYIDIHEAPSDSRIQSLLNKIKYLPFTSEITDSGKEFAINKIKEPFLCAQLRLLDGQFKNHWKTTFSALKQKIKSVRLEAESKLTSTLHIFIMTDLPKSNWTGTYLADLADNSNYKLYTLSETDDIVEQSAKRLMQAEHGMRSSFLPKSQGETLKNRHCDTGRLPDILLFVEETICSCASLGFVGTAGSTIAESIELMRDHNVCKLSNVPKL